MQKNTTHIVKAVLVISSALAIAPGPVHATSSDCDKFILAEVARAEKVMRADVLRSNRELEKLTDPKQSKESPKDQLARKVHARLLMDKGYRKAILGAQTPLAIYKKEAAKPKDSKVCRERHKVPKILDLSVKQHRKVWSSLMAKIRAFDPKR